MYKLSILTVVKNNYRGIDLTIKSIISQSIKEKELIIVDGFSTDGTWEIIEKYTEKYPFIKSFKKTGLDEQILKMSYLFFNLKLINFLKIIITSLI